MVDSFGESGGKETSRVWHYTKGGNLPFIVESGVIRRSWGGFWKKRQQAVWGSMNPLWESTVDCKASCGRARIELKPQALPFTWKQYMKKGKLDPFTGMQLEGLARAGGDDVRNWRIGFNDVPSTEWLSIEIFKDGQWRKWFGEVFIGNKWRDPTPKNVALFHKTFSMELVEDQLGNVGYALVSPA
jgi:hypothetical protein